MSPIELWKKVMESVSSRTPKKAKKPIKNLIILMGLGVALMLISNFYSAHQNQTKQDVAATPTSGSAKQTSSEVKPASILKSKSNEPKTMDEYASYYEERLTSMLNSMAGLSNAKVLVTLSTGPENVYQQDSKTTDQRTVQHDSNGGTSTTTNQSNDETMVTIDQGNGQKGPLLVTQKGPTVKAILVVANGVTQPAEKERVIDAVSTVLDVPSYKVSVQERK